MVKVHKDLVVDNLKSTKTLTLPNETVTLALPVAPRGSIIYDQTTKSPYIFARGSWVQMSSTGSATRRDYIFHPGYDGPADPSIYTRWRLLFAALEADRSLSPNQEANIRFISTDATAVIPAGTYNMENVKWVAETEVFDRSTIPVGVNPTTLTIQDGAIFTNLAKIKGYMDIEYQGTTEASITISTNVSGSPLTTVLRNGVNIRCTGSQPFWKVESGAVYGVDMKGSCRLITDANAVIRSENTSGPGVILTAGNLSTIDNLSLTGTNSGDFTFRRDGTNVSLSEDPTQFPGTTIADVPTQISYEATTSGDWLGTTPIDNRDAIDRIAAAVAGLLGGGIP